MSIDSANDLDGPVCPRCDYEHDLANGDDLPVPLHGSPYTPADLQMTEMLPSIVWSPKSNISSITPMWTESSSDDLTVSIGSLELSATQDSVSDAVRWPLIINTTNVHRWIMDFMSI